MVNPQDQLKQELDALYRYLQRVRQEIAAIDRPADQDHRFESMGDQMDAIVEATETATNTIMEAMESTEETNGKLREGITDPAQVMLLDQINTNVNKVFEACAFQDITGQRVNRVARSITYVEERVNALIALFGEEQISEIEVVVPPGQEKTADEKLVSGPHAEGIGLSQDDIDKLFD
jgi:chemotaxis protein CheZ